MKQRFNFEDNLLGRNLLEARKRSGFSLRSVSEELKQNYGIDISYAGISRWELGQTYPNPPQLIALCDLYGIEYVSDLADTGALNEAGLAKLSEYRADLIATGKYEKQNIPEPAGKLIPFPESFLSASAGTGSFLEESRFVMEMVPASEIPAGADYRVKIHGDSMEPAFHDGQYVYVQKTPEPRQYEIGIFMLNGSGYMKLFSLQTPQNKEEYIDSEGVLHMQPVLISLNPKYPPLRVRPSDTLEFGGRVL